LRQTARPLTLRLAVKADAPHIVNLVAQCWQRDYAAILPHAYLHGDAVESIEGYWKSRFLRTAANQLLMVAEIDGQVVAGMCAYGALKPGGEAAIDSLYVAQEHQGKGIGKALLAKAAQWCAEGFQSTSLELWVVKAVTDSVAFYASQGAVSVGTTIWKPSCGGEIEQFEMRWADISTLYRSNPL
jgi:GNAT superfamily N-acetyltransferase